MRTYRFVNAVLLFTVLGAGCFSPSAAPVSEGPTSSTLVVNQPHEAVTSTTPTPTSTVPEPPKRWDVAEIAERDVTFTPPKGYWVYYTGNSHRFYLVPGSPPKAGSPDPEASAIKNAVASFYVVQDDMTSFPSWRRFGLTMAQFDCAQGTNDANFINCGDKPTTEVESKTDGLYPTWQFTLPAQLRATRASRGTRTFMLVSLGDRTFGILVAVVSGKSATPAAALVKSMKGM